MKYIWDRQSQKFVPSDDFFSGRQSSAAPRVHTDSVDAFRSHADGKMYDSKSNYRRELRARGLVEVGNERIEPKPRSIPDVSGLRGDIQRTISELS